MFSILSQLNYQLFQLLNAHAGAYAWFDGLMAFCAEWLILCWPVILFLAWGRPLVWRKKQLTAIEMARLQDRRSAVLWVALACLFAYGLNLLIEQFIFEPRPFISHRVHVLVQHVADSSFPSDHTAWSFAVVGMLAFSLLPGFTRVRPESKMDKSPLTKYGLLLFVVALLMACTIGVARIFVGVHYPDDILGGAIDGLLGAGLATYLRHLLSRPTNAVIQFAQRCRLA